MKNFFTSMLGALVALVIFTFGGALLFIGFIGAMAAMSGDKVVQVERGSYLVLDLASAITDAPAGNRFPGAGRQQYHVASIAHRYPEPEGCGER